MPEPLCELRHENAWQLLIATILSAQSTDRTVNRVTPALFSNFPDAASLAAASRERVEELVRPTGFFRVKARNIQEASRVIVNRHRGQVPTTMAELVELPGVARKTANVVLGTAHAIASGFVVDTHVGRVARRLDLTKEKDPVKVEHDLCRVFSEDTWIRMSHRLVLHGRYVCIARKPACDACPIAELCPSCESLAREGSAERAWQKRADAERAVVDASYATAIALEP